MSRRLLWWLACAVALALPVIVLGASPSDGATSTTDSAEIKTPSWTDVNDNITQTSRWAHTEAGWSFTSGSFVCWQDPPGKPKQPVTCDTVILEFQVKTADGWRTRTYARWDNTAGGKWDPKDTKPRDAREVRLLATAWSDGGKAKVATEP